jgi:hypothetical protein
MSVCLKCVRKCILKILSNLQQSTILLRSKKGLIVTCAPSLASRSPGCSLWHTPVTIVTCTCMSSDSPGLHHFPDYLPYMSLPLVPSPGVIDAVSVSCLCAVRVSSFVLCCVNLLKHSLSELASRLSAHIVTFMLYYPLIQ